MTVTVSEIREQVDSVLAAADREIKAIYLFGSQARRDADNNSDIDIALIDSSFEDVPMAERGIWFKREWDYGGVGPLELYCLTLHEYEERLAADHETVRDIEAEGVELSSN